VNRDLVDFAMDWFSQAEMDLYTLAGSETSSE